MAVQGKDCSAELQQRIQAAAEARQPLYLGGSGSKSFYVTAANAAERLDLTAHRGIVSYEPTELVLTARAGTPLAELEQVLAEHGQLLPFEPPHFDGNPTLGGAVAAGFSGPRRFALGTVRDSVLGVECITGRGERLRFGGTVMKNVAGYDVSRLMVGSFGNLACLLEISIKVMPAPEQELTHVLELEYGAGLELIRRLTAAAIPLSATAYLDGRLYLRLSGTERVLAAAAREIGSEPMASAEARQFWRDLRDQRLPFFQRECPLWRISLPPFTELPALHARGLGGCGGQIVWLHEDAELAALLPQVQALGGYARPFRAASEAGAPAGPALSPVLARLFQRVKQSFDPHGIFNSSRRFGDS